MPPILKTVSAKWPAGIKPVMPVRFPHLVIADVDNTVTINSDTPLTQPNLGQITWALQNQSRIDLISGSPYWADDPGLGGRRTGSLEFKAADPIRQALSADPAPMQFLKLLEVSGRGAVTFDETGQETIIVNSKKIMPGEMQVNIAKAMAAGFYAAKIGEGLNALLESMTGRAIANLECPSYEEPVFHRFLQTLLSLVRNKKTFPGVEIHPFGSEIALGLFNENCPSSLAVLNYAGAYLERLGIKPGPKYFRYHGPDFIKYSMIRKADVIAEEIKRCFEAFKREKCQAKKKGPAEMFTVAAFGDSTVDDFLHLVEPPKSVAYFPFYLGPAVNMRQFPHVFAVRRQSDLGCGIEAAGFAPVLRMFREAAERGLTYQEVPGFTAVEKQNTFFI